MRDDGHLVHTPDLYDGRTFAALVDGMAYARELGFPTILDRGHAAVADLPPGLVFAGFSLGVMPAQLLAQTRPGARGAILLHACVPPSEFGGDWPAAVPLQIHVMEDDSLGDVDVARDVAASTSAAELHLYPGDRHLFTDSSLPDYDPGATFLVHQRIAAFLG
jgi:dienelactone hydrolase